MIPSGYYPLLNHYIINLTLTAYKVWLNTRSAWFARFDFHIKINSCAKFGKSKADIDRDSFVYSKSLQLSIINNFFAFCKIEFYLLD
ncbi:hypothetical protein D1BOALGB6SA_3759 [Olavius sp. associated proteobacterium Delta 1]|nr:hypothetical protein D1BOALGB6SA_3759 [Olavius sp. associated proteobacterium Delta 1]